MTTTTIGSSTQSRNLTTNKNKAVSGGSITHAIEEAATKNVSSIKTTAGQNSLRAPSHTTHLNSAQAIQQGDTSPETSASLPGNQTQFVSNYADYEAEEFELAFYNEPSNTPTLLTTELTTEQKKNVLDRVTLTPVPEMQCYSIENPVDKSEKENILRIIGYRGSQIPIEIYGANRTYDEANYDKNKDSCVKDLVQLMKSEKNQAVVFTFPTKIKREKKDKDGNIEITYSYESHAVTLHKDGESLAIYEPNQERYHDQLIELIKKTGQNLVPDSKASDYAGGNNITKALVVKLAPNHKENERPNLTLRENTAVKLRNCYAVSIGIALALHEGKYEAFSDDLQNVKHFKNTSKVRSAGEEKINEVSTSHQNFDTNWVAATPTPNQVRPSESVITQGSVTSAHSFSSPDLTYTSDSNDSK